MFSQRFQLIILVIGFSIALPSTVLSAENEAHEDHSTYTEENIDEDGHNEAPGTVELEAKAMELAGIVVQPLSIQSLAAEIAAPGEVSLNGYSRARVTPRIDAQVLKRHARLGDEVVQGQPLVTLLSVDLAQAISVLLVADKEWARVKQLNSSVVSAKRRSEAQIAREQALAIAKAYGVSADQLDGVLRAGVAEDPGAFQLLAPQDGVVVSDDFIIGELIEPGRIIFDIVDETSLWVESRLPPDLAVSVQVGAKAKVRGADGTWLPAKVIQKHHMLDEETRTIGVRMEVANEEDRLHAGMYVDTRILSQSEQGYLAVPTASVLRGPDGDWIVFVEEEPGHFKPEEVEVIRTLDDYSVIEGIAEGTRIVTRGAFFVQSELAKSGFEVHNH